MIRKNKHTVSRTRRFLLGITTAVGIMSALWCGSFVSLADATATVKFNAKIREKADTNSTVVGSASQGKTVTLKSEVADASGTAWYEVYIESGTTGYIRADLVEKNNDGDVPKVAAGSTDNQSDADAAASSGAPGATVQAENAMDAQYATVSVNCKVRSAPSTNDTVVENLAVGAQVVVSGQSGGSSDNKTWYYVTFTGANGSEKSGFIRSDLLSLGDMVPMPEEAPPEEPEMPVEPEAPVYNSDYELSYRDAEGAWYLIDYATGGEYPLSQLLNAVQNQSSEVSEDAKALVKQRIAIVVLIVLAVVLIIAVVIMAVKLRDAYYEDYEDDEEDEDEDEDDEDEEEEEEVAPSRRRRRVEEAEETPSRSRRRVEEEEETPSRRRRRAEEEETPSRRRRRMEEEEAPKPAANTAAKRKAKNFLLDDEEFEFEFLNMDDKK